MFIQAILGTQGVLFSMSHLKDAFLVSAAASRGTSSLSMDRIQFPALRYDYTIRQFYTDSQLGEEVNHNYYELIVIQCILPAYLHVQ